MRAVRRAFFAVCGLLVCHAVDGEDAVVIERAELADNAGVEEGAALGKLTQLLLAEHAVVGIPMERKNSSVVSMARRARSRSLSPSWRVRRQTASP